jgi:pimeloyl-ACP methyl ester carboxylesterase
MTDPREISGTTANGVPFVALPALSSSAPVIVAWHLLDPPRTPAAFAAALPLAGLDAHRIYLGLPLSGARGPEGGFDGVLRLIQEDAVTRFFGALHAQAAAEFPAAFAELRERLGVAKDAKVGLLGGSAGSAVAADVLASGTSGASAAVLVSPMLQLRPMVNSFGQSFQIEYAWHPEADRLAARMDFVARASEIVATKVPVRLIVGADDEVVFLEPAKAFAAATGADLHVIEGVAHPLAEEPGLEPAPQIAAALRFDALAVEWFRAKLAR